MSGRVQECPVECKRVRKDPEWLGGFQECQGGSGMVRKEPREGLEGSGIFWEDRVGGSGRVFDGPRGYERIQEAPYSQQESYFFIFILSYKLLLH